MFENLFTSFKVYAGRIISVSVSILFINTFSMLYTIATILVILWLLGLVTSYTLGGFIHLLLVIAIIVVLVKVIRGEKVL